ncbi:MAG: glutathione S-transferase [Kaistia sp. SCN 65-12]|nr:MAG: glutathione S-transferase [Kaistia sp. SCN 65-12]
MKLYYMAGACPLAAHIVLEWTGANYESEKLSHADLKKDAYLRVNPLGAVPALEVDGSVITQNAGVLSYLAEAYPDARLGGDGTPRGDAEVHRWLGFVNSDIHPAFKPLFGSTAYLRDEAIIEKTKAHAKESLRRLFEIADTRLKDRDWIAGQRSVADAYLFVVLRWAHAVKVDLSGFAGIERYYGRMQKDPGVVKALAAEGLA